LVTWKALMFTLGAVIRFSWAKNPFPARLLKRSYSCLANVSHQPANNIGSLLLMASPKADGQSWWVGDYEEVRLLVTTQKRLKVLMTECWEAENLLNRYNKRSTFVQYFR